MSRKVRLDMLDFRILEILQIDASIKNKDLAETIGLSPPATLVRVNHLIKDGYISERAQGNVNFQKLNFEYTCRIITQIPKSAEEEFKNIIIEVPNVLTTFEIIRDSELDFDKYKHYTSLCVYRTRQDMIISWSDIVSKLSFPLEYQVYKVGCQFRSKYPVPITEESSLSDSQSS